MAAASGELVRRVSRVVAARRRLICRERVSCKIRARPTLEARPADVWSGRIVKSGKRIPLWSFLQKSNSRHSFTASYTQADMSTFACFTMPWRQSPGIRKVSLSSNPGNQQVCRAGKLQPPWLTEPQGNAVLANQLYSVCTHL